MSEAPPIKTRYFERFALHPDAGRALRTALGMGVPLFVCHALGRPPMEAIFIALTSQSLTLQDLRGAYGVRLVILAVMTLVMAGSTMLGIAFGGDILSAVVAMGVIALLGGVWRHLSIDYGPPLGIFSAFLFLLAGANAAFSRQEHLPAWYYGGLVLAGGVSATLIDVCFWIFNRQHPFRFAVSETWIAASDLVAKMRSDEKTGDRAKMEDVAAAERNLRAALDRTFQVLATGKTPRRKAIIPKLEEMRREVVHFSMRVIAFNSSLEAIRFSPGFDHSLPLIDSVFKTLGDAARSVGLTLITHRPENLAATEVRLQRCENFVRLLDDQLIAVAEGGNVAVMQVRATLGEVALALPRIGKKLAETADHASVRSIFPQVLPDFGERSIRSLAAWVNPSLVIDPLIVRHSVRMAVVTMLGMAIYMGFHVPRGYWIVLTVIVVLQPDYGSTRDRAVQRVAGTLGGILVAGCLIAFHMPWWLLDLCIAFMTFCFAWFVKTRYGIGIFFLTLMFVLISETAMHVDWNFTLVRFFCTFLGGVLALIAALVFWPAWEREKFPALLATALRANLTFLDSMLPWFGAPAASTGANVDPLFARRVAENANRIAAESLKRMTAEPTVIDEDAERAAGLSTGCQRITRALTAVAVHAEGGVTLRQGTLIPGLVRDIEAALDTLARSVAAGGNSATDVKAHTVAMHASLDAIDQVLATVEIKPAQDNPTGLTKGGLIWTQLSKCVSEIHAMVLTLELPGKPLRRRVAVSAGVPRR